MNEVEGHHFVSSSSHNNYCVCRTHPSSPQRPQRPHPLPPRLPRPRRRRRSRRRRKKRATTTWASACSTKLTFSTPSSLAYEHPSYAYNFSYVPGCVVGKQLGKYAKFSIQSPFHVDCGRWLALLVTPPGWTPIWRLATAFASE